MQIEDYFDFLAPDDIRVKGTRIGVESILYEHIHRGQPPELSARFHEQRIAHWVHDLGLTP